MSHDPLLFSRCEKSVAAATVSLEEAKQSVAHLVKQEGRISTELLEEQQFAAHGLAWMATYVAALDTLLDWARKLDRDGEFRQLESLLLKIAFGEYLSQIRGGIAISQVEILRPVDMGLSAEQESPISTEIGRAHV